MFGRAIFVQLTKCSVSWTHRVVHEKSYPIEVGVKGPMGYGRGYLFS